MPQNTEFSHIASDAPANGYKSRLNSWAIARLLPDTQQEIAARFRSRSDADGHLQLLRKLTPSANFLLVFDCQRDEVVA
jgi:hypothetical protein